MSRSGGVPLGIGVTSCVAGWVATVVFAFLAVLSATWWPAGLFVPLMFVAGPTVSVALTAVGTARRARARGDVEWKRVALANTIVIGIIATFINFVLCLLLFMLLATLFPLPA